MDKLNLRVSLKHTRTSNVTKAYRHVSYGLMQPLKVHRSPSLPSKTMLRVPQHPGAHVLTEWRNDSRSRITSVCVALGIVFPDQSISSSTSWHLLLLH